MFNQQYVIFRRKKGTSKNLLRDDFMTLLGLFLLYISYLLLGLPVKEILEFSPLSISKIASISSIILLLPLLFLLVWVIRKWDFKKFSGLEGGLLPENRRWLWLPVLYVVFVLLNKFSVFRYPETSDLLLYLIGFFLVGFTEEFFFRGILLPKAIGLFSEFKDPVLLGVLFSSVLFGVFHLINLFFGASLEETAFQVLFAFCAGILFCGIFLKTKSILIPSLLHSIWDINETIGFLGRSQVVEIAATETPATLHQVAFSEILRADFPVLLFLLVAGGLFLFVTDRKERALAATNRW